MWMYDWKTPQGAVRHRWSLDTAVRPRLFSSGEAEGEEQYLSRKK